VFAASEERRGQGRKNPLLRSRLAVGGGRCPRAV